MAIKCGHPEFAVWHLAETPVRPPFESSNVMANVFFIPSPAMPCMKKDAVSLFFCKISDKTHLL